MSLVREGGDGGRLCVCLYEEGAGGGGTYPFLSSIPILQLLGFFDTPLPAIMAPWVNVSHIGLCRIR